MPNIKSAKKRVRITNKKAILNNDFKSSMKTAIKNVEKSIHAGQKEEAYKNLDIAVRRIDKAAKKGIIKANTRDRSKSRLTKKVAAMK